jgi:hypothetical protein
MRPTSTRDTGLFTVRAAILRTAALHFAAAILVGGSASAAVGDGVAWKPLFDGKTLDGWVQRGGKAKYTVENGTLVGTTVPKTPNSFLCTDRNYGDFILELEFKCDPKLNSGIQIRSNAYEKETVVLINGAKKKTMPADRVHGYQVEIDPDVERGRMNSGGIYDEARRGWLDPISGDTKAAEAFSVIGRTCFKAGGWNRFRIQAVGDSIKVWLNDTPRADLVDAMTQTGVIALQVHGIGKRTDKLQVSWRNIRIKDLGEHVWKPLFDGKTLDGWEPLPGGTWEVADGAILGKSPRSERRHGMLLSKTSHSDFTARHMFKVTKGDSGFYFRVKRVNSRVSVHGFQVEVDTSYETGGLYETGGRAWVSKPDPVENKKWYRPGEWNEMILSARGHRIVVIVNGRRITELKNDTKSRTEGFFGLQLHGGQEMHVEFKDLALLVKKE